VAQGRQRERLVARDEDRPAQADRAFGNGPFAVTVSLLTGLPFST
jgi:hypothetical protein